MTPVVTLIFVCSYFNKFFILLNKRLYSIYFEIKVYIPQATENLTLNLCVKTRKGYGEVKVCKKGASLCVVLGTLLVNKYKVTTLLDQFSPYICWEKQKQKVDVLVKSFCLFLFNGLPRPYFSLHSLTETWLMKVESNKVSTPTNRLQITRNPETIWLALWPKRK